MKSKVRPALKTVIRKLAVIAAAVSLFGGLTTPVHALNPIMHNSSSTGSTYWGGGWGNKSTSKYGQFTCNTCHTAGLAGGNAKKIKSTISTPNGSNWTSTGTPNATVVFNSYTTYGDVNAHTTSTRICEVCHSQTLHHKYNQAASAHNGNVDCMTSGCHSHSNGFKKPAGGCTSCHGNPPTTVGTLVQNPATTGATNSAVGAHDKHVNTRSMTCGTCHFGSVMPSYEHQIQMGFDIKAANWPQFTGTATYGNFSGHSPLTNSFTWTATNGTTYSADTTSYRDSCYVYCHGGWSGSGGTRVSWTNDVGNVVCGKCHGASASAPPTRGSHKKHAGNGTYTGYSISCTTCHPSRANGNVTHITGSVQWQLSTGKAVVGTNAKYNSAASGSTGTLAPSATYASCTQVYCHSNGRSGADQTYNTPTWGGASIANCIRCHGNSNVSLRPMSSNAHRAHVNNTAAKFNGLSLACNNCHAQTVNAFGNITSINTRSSHVNGTKTVVWGTVAGTGASAYTGNGNCTVYCHSKGTSPNTFVAPPNWQNYTSGRQGKKSCDMCHGGTVNDATVQNTNKHLYHVPDSPASGFPHVALACSTCHRLSVNATGTAINTSATSLHLDGTKSVRLKSITFSNRSGVYSGSNCSNTYCHGNTTTNNWVGGASITCGACHSTTNDGNMSGPHAKHISTLAVTKTDAWTNTPDSTGQTYKFKCGVCHNTQTQHVNGPQVSGQGDAQVILNLPFGAGGGTVSATKGSTTGADGRGYNYSTGTTCSNYCHSSGKATWTSRNPSWNAGTVVCGSCHAVASNKTYSSDWSGAHMKHNGPSSTNALRQYSSNNSGYYKCGTCHSATVQNGTSTTIISSSKHHVDGYRNVSGNTWAGNGTTTFTWSSGTSTCTNVYCHSDGRSTVANGLRYNTTPAWTGTLANGCLSCHGGKSNATTYAASAAGFKLSTTHQRHIGKYPSQMDCNNCHGKTAASYTALKDYTGVRYHVNKTKNVTLTGLAYSTYTSYKGTKNCGSVSCHGGLTKTAWSENGALSGDYVCVKCHGVTGTLNGSNVRLFAPGYKTPTGNKGTDTNQSASRNSLKTGAHFKHLSSMYMKKLHCNECHLVPSAPFDNGHFNIQRYGLDTGVLKFDQASSARWDGQNSVNLALASFKGYTTAQNSGKAATCSQMYCHGNRLKNNEVGGAYRKPYWNYSGLIKYSDAAATVCAKCHGYPPTASGHTTSTTCSGCHLNISSADNKTFIDKSKHINRTVEVTLSCKGCHGTGATKDVQSEFAKNSHHTNKAWASITDADCVVCHAEGSISGGVVTVDTSTGGRHGGTNGVTGVVDLYNADNRATIYTITLSLLTAHDNTSNTTLDTFCFSCHDSGGATAVTSANGFTDGRSATNPFNDSSLSNSYDQQTRAFGAAPAALNVYDAFATTNYSHHAVRGARYTKTTGLSFGTSLSAAGLLSSTVTLANGTTGVTDMSTLHCSDCHSVAWSAHGSANEYLLQTATSENPTVEHTTNTDVVCAKCHSGASSYAGGGNHTGNGGDEVWTASSTGTARASGNGHITGIACLNCHDGNVGFGGIHGVPNATYTAGGSGGTYNKRRFMPGSSLYMYDPDTGDAGTDAGWETATAANKCYTLGTAGSVGSCTKHSGGVALGKRNTRRPVTY